MPPPSKISLLPEPLRAALDRKLIDGGFSGLVALAEWLTDQGFEISKTTVGDYSQALKRRLAAIKASTEAAKLIAQAAPDEADERSGASISMVQTSLFEALLAMEEATEAPDPAARVEILTKAARGLAELTRASVTRNKWAAEVHAKASAAAEDIKKIASKGGLSEEAIAAIDAKIMGIA